ncbi:GntR family transcriptional regulator [Microbacterium fluvii]|uniref:GntR family transcriptional regulator n=1 Tax=Microbacterium fluvii TaxID=415215 RepID=A0ABW2HHR6_9MICO|nr:GntR family transcriptional regulator [Microbacterium fluvii]MCU4673772.1 GntR family transcriptional regulator [Microbacterium fluvii]
MSAPFSPLEPTGTVLGDEVYERIAAAILDGTLPPGQRLRDHDLASMLGVSRTPVREALQRLARSGLVEVAPHRYTRVRARSEKSRTDTHDFIVLFMGNVIGLALARASDEELDVLVEHAEAMVEASREGEIEALLSASSDFLSAGTRISRNQAFQLVLDEAEVAIRHNLEGWHPFIECPVTRTAGYVQLRDAIAARDCAAAEARVRELHGFS